VILKHQRDQTAADAIPKWGRALRPAPPQPTFEQLLHSGVVGEDVGQVRHARERALGRYKSFGIDVDGGRGEHGVERPEALVVLERRRVRAAGAPPRLRRRRSSSLPGGRVAEWLNAAVSKTVSGGFPPTGVRIPPLPLCDLW
jgi:hypothetical protein